MMPCSAYPKEGGRGFEDSMTANSMTVKKIAEKRMRRLFQLAEEEIRSSSQDLCEVQKTDPIHHTTTRKEEGIGYSNRYVTLARKIGMRYRVRIPEEYRIHLCRKCNSYLYPGINCRIRIRKDHNSLRKMW